jgi:hypothetical protein
VDTFWGSLEGTLSQYDAHQQLILEPDFQRSHVWTEHQQVGFVEWGLQGGLEFSGGHVLFNCSDWRQAARKPVVLVDGLQRLTAVRRFLAGELRAFGNLYGEFEGKLSLAGPRFRFTVNNLKTKKDVLEWYLKLNAGGTVHSKPELDHVRNMLTEIEGNPENEDDYRGTSIR